MNTRIAIAGPSLKSGPRGVYLLRGKASLIAKLALSFTLVWKTFTLIVTTKSFTVGARMFLSESV